MKDADSALHFPSNISLTTAPLVEAWLDIRWQLEPSKTFPGSLVDPNFPFALGVFYERVSDRFGTRAELPLGAVPTDAIPYTVRYKFTQDSSTSPILQLGPGVATVNYTDDYNWEDFEKDASYLREKLRIAYPQLSIQSMTLRYRNTFSFDYLSHNLSDFLKSHLNLSLELPPYIPGEVARTTGPTGWQSVFTYDLLNPVGKGVIRFATGQQVSEGSTQQTPVLIFDLEVQSQGLDVPDFSSEDSFRSWMKSAHSVIHEWFFAFIDGTLRKKYEEDT